MKQICKCGHDDNLYHQGTSCSQWNTKKSGVIVYCPCKKFEAVHDNPKCGFGEICNNCEKRLKGWIKEWSKNEN